MTNFDFLQKHINLAIYKLNLILMFIVKIQIMKSARDHPQQYEEQSEEKCKYFHTVTTIEKWILHSISIYFCSLVSCKNLHIFLLLFDWRWNEKESDCWLTNIIDSSLYNISGLDKYDHNTRIIQTHPSLIWHTTCSLTQVPHPVTMSEKLISSTTYWSLPPSSLVCKNWCQ